MAEEKDGIEPLVHETVGPPLGDQSQTRLDKTGNFDAVKAAQKAADQARELNRNEALSVDESQVVSEEGTMKENIQPGTTSEAGGLIGEWSVDKEHWDESLDFE